jgi:K319L-like, PKD domain
MSTLLKAFLRCASVLAIVICFNTCLLGQEPESKESERSRTETKSRESRVEDPGAETLPVRRFSSIHAAIGSPYGPSNDGSLSFFASSRFLTSFDVEGAAAIQAQAEFTYDRGRQEAQFDLGLLHRWQRWQGGMFSSVKYINLTGQQSGGFLGQALFAFDRVFDRGKVGVYGTKGFKSTAVLNKELLAPMSTAETYLSIVDQAGVTIDVSVLKSSYVESSLTYLRQQDGGSRMGGLVRWVLPVSDRVAFTAETAINDALVTHGQSGRALFGVRFGNFLHPSHYIDVRTPTPVVIPRIRYEMLSRHVGNSAPVADAGPNQVGLNPGTIRLSGAGSRDPDGDSITYQWEQVTGPTVSLSSSTAVSPTFSAAAGQTYSFRLTVRDPSGLQGIGITSVSTVAPLVPRILRFDTASRTIRVGEHTTLSWLVENVDLVSISGIGGVNSQGSMDIAPARTTEYTLTAHTNGVADAIATTVVVVVESNPSIIRFDATPTFVNSGGSAVLSWATNDAVRVEISNIGAVSINGSRSVAVTVTTTYVLTAFGADGRSVTAPVIVTVPTNPFGP